MVRRTSLITFAAATLFASCAPHVEFPEEPPVLLSEYRPEHETLRCGLSTVPPVVANPTDGWVELWSDGAMRKITDVRVLDRRPRLVSGNLGLEGRSGSALVEMFIAENGRIMSIRCQSLDPSIRRAAQSTAGTWRVSAGVYGGKKVPTRTVLHIPLSDQGS